MPATTLRLHDLQSQKLPKRVKVAGIVREHTGKCPTGQAAAALQLMAANVSQKN
jgi:hypothetical protein